MHYPLCILFNSYFKAILKWSFLVFQKFSGGNKESLFGSSVIVNLVCVVTRDGSRFSNIRIVNLIIEYRLGYAIIF